MSASGPYGKAVAAFPVRVQSGIPLHGGHGPMDLVDADQSASTYIVLTNADNPLIGLPIRADIASI